MNSIIFNLIQIKSGKKLFLQDMSKNSLKFLPKIKEIISLINKYTKEITDFENIMMFKYVAILNLTNERVLFNKK
jgi:hypothetical protein